MERSPASPQLITDGIYLELQGIYHCKNISDRELISYEVLCRKKLGDTIVPPNQFLEDISPEDALALDLEVFRLALERPEHDLSINIFPSSLLDPSIIDFAKDNAEKIQRKNITLELVERQPVTDFSAIAGIAFALKSLGIDFALDDFGTVNASLQNLLLLPVSKVKIDRSFLVDEVYSRDRLNILKRLCLTAKQPNAACKKPIPILEGVENEALLGLGLEAGFRHFQGWLFS